MGRTRSIMGVKGAPVASRPGNPAFDDGLGARKRVFIPGYSGCISRMQETIAGTFAQNSRESHYLVYHGCKPTMEAATLPAPDCFYARAPNPRIKTNAANRSNFQFGDERDWGFETLNESQFKVPTKIPPRHASILPNGPGSTKEELDSAYVNALNKIGITGVKRLELAIRMKIDQRTTGGPMALRKAFKYFDADASGDIDPDEFYAAMHAFGLEFTEDQVMALFGYYDVDRDGALSYYEFIDKVLGSGFSFNSGKTEPEYAVLQPMPAAVNEEAPVMRTTISKELLEQDACKKVFDRYDINKSGEIDLRELAQLVRSLGLSLDREAINNAMFDLDLNQNGTISFEEFWTWWQKKASRGGNSQPAPIAKRRVTAQGEAVPREEGEVPVVASTKSSKSGAGLRALHERVSQDIDRAKSKSRTGHWEAGGRPSSSLSALGRPLSRNSMQSTLTMDFQHPPLIGRAPRVHNLQSLRRPHTAPVDSKETTPYSRTPDIPGVPRGQTTGFRL